MKIKQKSLELFQNGDSFLDRGMRGKEAAKSAEGIFVMEHPKTNDFSGLPYFYQHRVYGSVNFSIFIKEEEKTDA